MAKSTLELKQAISQLNVKKPFDLRHQNQTGLKPPRIEETQNEVIQVEVAPKKEAQEEVAPLGQSQSEKPQTVVTQMELPRSGLPQKEHTSLEGAGYFRLSYRAFVDPRFRALPGDAFRLFLWMTALAWRFPDSTGELRASVSYIETGTGISHAAISRHLGVLRQLKLIECREINYKTGNLWRVEPILRGNSLSRKEEHSKNKDPQKEIPRFELEAPSKREICNPTSSEQLPRIEREERKFKNSQETQKISLSEIGSDKLHGYFSELKPARKRESEYRAYRELKRDYSDDQIAGCLSWVTLNGVSDSHESCHSPMAYLAVAIGEVLTKIDLERGLAHRKAEQEQAQRVQFEKKLRGDEEERRCWERKEQAFNREFPDEDRQGEIIREMCQKFQYKLRGEAARSLAISAWWDEVGSKLHC